jgi:hypothetical protein
MPRPELTDEMEQAMLETILAGAIALFPSLLQITCFFVTIFWRFLANPFLLLSASLAVQSPIKLPGINPEFLLVNCFTITYLLLINP